jgi:branched-chain amino acid transport system ATP-binding protein
MEPRLLLLDEPVAGMNREETEDMARHLLEIREGLGCTTILVEHQLDLVMDVADRVAVLDFGVLVAVGTPDEVRNDPRVMAAYLGAGEP